MYEKTVKSWEKHLDFMILDFICMHISLLLASLLRFTDDFHHRIDFYITMATIFSLSFLVIILFYAGYKNIIRRGAYVEFVEVLKKSALVSLLSVLVLYLTKKSTETSRLVFVLYFAIDVLLSYFVRLIHKNNLKKKDILRNSGRSMIIVCTAKNAELFLERIRTRDYGINITGIIVADKNLKGTDIQGIPVVANTDDAIMYICRNWVDEIFIGKKTNDTMPEFVEDLKQACQKMGITIHTMLLSISDDQEKVMTEKFAGFLVLSQSVAIVTKREMLLKRLMDICGGLVGCLITCVLFIIFAPMIYIASPGPIFFSQQRVGKNGKPFKIYKFRSMYMDAEERKAELMKQNKVKDGMMFKMDKDPRIIKGIGHFIRDYSIDEFPQFMNVLKGDMSLVGTRPPTLDEWEKYELHHRKRLAIKPGLTGMWQVSGRSNITDFEEIVKLDTQYIDEWSLGLDIKIIFKTIAVVLTKEGSQ